MEEKVLTIRFIDDSPLTFERANFDLADDCDTFWEQQQKQRGYYRQETNHLIQTSPKWDGLMSLEHPSLRTPTQELPSSWSKLRLLHKGSSKKNII